MDLSGESRALRDALVSAYRPYVEAAIASAGLDAPPGLEDALRKGESWLGEALDRLLSLPFREQPRGPLEVFQEAMRFPSGALEQAGAEPAERDPAVREALPGDLYGLAPASSRDLGEGVWEAHLGWGAAKARAFRPAVGMLSADLMDRSRVEPDVNRAGFRLVVWGSAAAIDPAEPVLAAFVDLTHPEADGVVARLAGEGVRVVAFGPHVDDLAMVRARTLGAAEAVARSAFFKSPAGHLPKLV
jgi:hypothetical protein